MSWDDIEEWVDKETKDLVQDAKEFAVESFMKKVTTKTTTKEVGKTPVLSGRLMANTLVTKGSPISVSRELFDKEGSATFDRAMGIVRSSSPFEKIYIQNNTESMGGEPYWKNAEYKGWKNTAPYYFFTTAYMHMLSEVKDK